MNVFILIIFSNRMPHMANNFKTAVFHVVRFVFAKQYMCRVTVQSFD